MSETVLLQPTIPIPCYGYPYNCSIQVQIATRQSECNPIKKKQRKTSKNNVLIDGCRFHILNENWNKTSNFNISWSNSGKYTAPLADLPNGYFIVQLKTIPAFYTKLWHDYVLPPIYVCTLFLHEIFQCLKYLGGGLKFINCFFQVQYKKQPAPIWEGNQCYAVNDPHMRTFNKR